ncbi:MAG: hypothetical protein P8J66_09930 [Verrucomicrobiota bacterium]|nr:hypothetical protein [Verrucomicrobiota bacterium]
MTARSLVKPDLNGKEISQGIHRPAWEPPFPELTEVIAINA